MRMSASGLKFYVLAVTITFAIKYLPAEAFCRTGWKAYVGRCYVFIHQRVPFMDAVAFCNKQRAELLEISSDGEQSFITSFVGLNKGGAVWLGITDLEQEGQWVSISSGGPITYTKWKEAEQNSSHGHGCGKLSESFWINYNCTTCLDFICEMREH